MTSSPLVAAYLSNLPAYRCVHGRQRRLLLLDKLAMLCRHRQGGAAAGSEYLEPPPPPPRPASPLILRRRASYAAAPACPRCCAAWRLAWRTASCWWAPSSSTAPCATSRWVLPLGAAAGCWPAAGGCGCVWQPGGLRRSSNRCLCAASVRRNGDRAAAAGQPVQPAAAELHARAAAQAAVWAELEGGCSSGQPLQQADACSWQLVWRQTAARSATRPPHPPLLLLTGGLCLPPPRAACLQNVAEIVGSINGAATVLILTACLSIYGSVTFQGEGPQARGGLSWPPRGSRRARRLAAAPCGHLAARPPSLTPPPVPRSLPPLCSACAGGRQDAVWPQHPARPPAVRRGLEQVHRRLRGGRPQRRGLGLHLRKSGGAAGAAGGARWRGTWCTATAATTCRQLMRCPCRPSAIASCRPRCCPTTLELLHPRHGQGGASEKTTPARRSAPTSQSAPPCRWYCLSLSAVCTPCRTAGYL